MDDSRKEFERKHESFIQEDKNWIMYGYDAGIKAAQAAMQPDAELKEFLRKIIAAKGYGGAVAEFAIEAEQLVKEK